MRTKRILPLLAGIAVIGFAGIMPAAAQLLISPLQVTIEGRTRNTDIVLVNTTQKVNTYRLEWEQVEQDQTTGQYKNSDMKSGQLFLQNFAVYTPRQITLAPGETQNVRIAVRRPAELADGEYKSHLKFKIVSAVAPTGNDGKPLEKREARFGAQVNTSFTIPVVYRSGEYDCKIDIGEPTFEQSESTGNLVVVVPVARSGIHGAIGQVDVYHKPDGGEETLIGALGNANIFPEITSRTFKVPTKVQGISSGTLRVVFLKAEGKTKAEYVQLTEKTYPVGN